MVSWRRVRFTLITALVFGLLFSVSSTTPTTRSCSRSAGVPARIFCGADRIEIVVTSDVAWFVGGRFEHVAHSLPALGGAA